MKIMLLLTALLLGGSWYFGKHPGGQSADERIAGGVLAALLLVLGLVCAVVYLSMVFWNHRFL